MSYCLHCGAITNASRSRFLAHGNPYREGIPGDALNVGLVGSKEDVLRAMHAAGGFPADPITLRTSIEIIGSVVLDRPHHDATMSPLYYDGKKGT